MPRKMNSTQIEKAGVEAVIRYFNFSETLDPNIPTTDKEPVWDGNLNLYRNGSDKQSKTSLIGPILTQVKGRQFNDFSNSKIKYPISVNDVKLYQKNGGIAFFVVYVNAETEATKIYYRLLAPIELRQIANNAGKKKKIAIEFNELPERNKIVELQFLDFYNDCSKQHSFSNQKPIHFQDVEKDTASFNIQFTAPTQNQLEALKYLSSTPQFCYVRFNNDQTQTLHPLGEGRFSFIAQNKANVPVTIDGKIYYEQSGLEVKDGKAYIVIADFIRIPLSNNKDEVGTRVTSKVTLNFKTLSQRLKGYDFLLTLKKTMAFNLGERTITFEDINIGNEVERIFAADKNLQTVLNMLNVKEDLNIQSVSNDDIKNINTLIDYYVLGKRVTSSEDVDHRFVRIDIGNIKLQFLAEKIDEPNYYKLHSVHDLSDFFFSTENDMGRFILMPAFFAFNTEAYRDISNISYESFVDECNRNKSNDNRFYQGINWAILRMLNAYDQQEEKKPVLIDTAKALNQWLIDNDPDKNSTFVHALNRLQIIKRIEPLKDKDKDLLYEYMDSDNATDEVKFACFTLLDDKHGAARFFKKLPEGKQEFYKTMPIYTLFTTLS